MRADGKNLRFTFGTVEAACVSSTAVLDNEDADSDLVTFADVINGLDKTWFFLITALPDYAPGSWWSLLWTTPAFTPIPYVFRPYGNDVATQDEPHFTGSVTVDRKPPVGGDAQAVWAFEARLTCTGAPVRVTTAVAADDEGDAA